MGKAARTPARCSCGAVGPMRGKPALAAGWSRIDGAWVCPDHVASVTRARNEAYERRVAEVERNLSRVAFPLIMAGAALGVGRPR